MLFEIQILLGSKRLFRAEVGRRGAESHWSGDVCEDVGRGSRRDRGARPQLESRRQIFVYACPLGAGTDGTGCDSSETQARLHLLMQ